MKICKQIKVAFTLAEVLITLFIIGVIASLVLPVLINDINEAETKTALKVAYSNADQAVKRIILENGGSLIGACADGDENCMVNKFKTYMTSVTSCYTPGSDSTGGGCWYKFGTVTALGGGTYGNWG